MENTIPTREQVFDAYYAAAAADQEFTNKVIRQFGARNAGDMRYRTDLHNAETLAAGIRSKQAFETWRALSRARNSQ